MHITKFQEIKKKQRRPIIQYFVSPMGLKISEYSIKKFLIDFTRYMKRNHNSSIEFSQKNSEQAQAN